MKKVKDIIYKSNNSIYDSNEPNLYTEEEVNDLPIHIHEGIYNTNVQIKNGVIHIKPNLNNPIKFYTKEEVKSILFNYAEEEHAWFSCKSEIESFNNWVKENLK